MAEQEFLKQILSEKDKELTKLNSNYQKILEENKQLKFALRTTTNNEMAEKERKKIELELEKLKLEFEKIREEHKLKEKIMAEELSSTKKQLELYKENDIGPKISRNRQETIRQYEIEYLKKNPGASLLNPNFDPGRGYDEID